ncbi:TetR/AcrR family transcriptional regulator [Marinobacter bryozoorum]|uniref:TetR/AcrR family transcriptional regulator n=1 Tax=Marinobacter bryozoorum TaxID=256324 RepID=UPI002002FCA4|nr:TetR/AcrR family transcriptional regulator [Marinobacter bryozoorum]MCK7545143.1 TetR/AcrR family transcriptional regulator [Marinobacter bryozoorum]
MKQKQFPSTHPGRASSHPERTQLQEATVAGVRNPSLAEKRREQICDAALELFLQKGFASTTIRDICARSGVNQASIYDYISNKNDILRRLLNQLWFSSGAPSLPDLLAEHPENTLQENVAFYLKEFWSKRRKGTLLAYRTVPHLTKEDRKAMRARDEQFISRLAESIEDLTHLPENDPRTLIVANLVLFMANFGPLRDWLHQDLDNDMVADTVAAAIVAMIENLARYSPEQSESPSIQD